MTSIFKHGIDGTVVELQTITVSGTIISSEKKNTVGYLQSSFHGVT